MEIVVLDLDFCRFTDEASDNALGVSPPKHLAGENKTLIQENAAEADSVDKIPPAERLVSDNEGKKIWHFLFSN